MEIKVEGRIIQKLEIETGTSARGEWKKQNFIIETVEQYPRKICIGIWTNQIPMLEQFQVGDMIWAYVNIESREFNGKWYTDVNGHRIESVNMEQPQQQSYDEPTLLIEQPIQGAMEYTTDFTTRQQNDNLPF